MHDEVVRDYLMLGLRMGRLVDGFVDCWFGDPELPRRAAAEPPADPVELAEQATRLRARLADGDLDAARRRYLAAQVDAVGCAARRLAGEEVPFLEEVATYFEVEIGLGDQDRYAAVHDEIRELLPGPAGDLRRRAEEFYERNLIPADKLAGCVRAVSGRLRARARTVFEIPDGEQVDYEIVHDRPWNAFNRYQGGFRSTVTLNDAAGGTIAALPLIATHESYPGHHTEHCIKEAELVNGLGHREHLISLVNTPQCLMAEGTAEHGVTALLGAGWGEWTAEILADQGVRIEGELVERMLTLVTELMPARQDAAVLLHDRGASVEDVVDYLRRWLLLPEDRARRLVRFLTDPLWRAYSVTYIEGARLVGGWLAARPAGQPLADRYRTLLREPLLPSMLRDDLALPRTA